MSVLSESRLFHMMIKKHYLSLDKFEECQVTYVWVDADGENVKCKTKTLSQEPTGIRDIPEWSCGKTIDGHIYDVTLVPVRMFRDPFILDPNKLVLCEVLGSDDMPTGGNQRSRCAKVMEKVKEFHPWFGMEQEYTLFGLDGKVFGWPPEGSTFTNVHCDVGSNRAYGRDISICHYKACLYAGVRICGANAEALPSQWEFQVGPCEGIEMGDHLWMARFILHLVCEDFGVVASLAVKPLKDKSFTSGCHANFSTKAMRREGGLQYIEAAIRKLGMRHSQHLCLYDPNGGSDNMTRLTSQSTTSSFHDFSSATGRRNVSIRIPSHVSQTGYGYLEDRRPASNCDPYIVTRALVETCLLETNGGIDSDDEEKFIAH